MRFSYLVRLLPLALLLLALWPLSSPATAQQAAWLSSPPPGGTPQCPHVNQWLFLYWSGAPTPIAQAANACPSADFLWARRSTGWLGFSKANPAASDTWTVQTGEAVFLHGAGTGAPIASGAVGQPRTGATSAATATATVVSTLGSTPSPTRTPTATVPEPVMATVPPSAASLCPPPTRPVYNQGRLVGCSYGQ